MHESLFEILAMLRCLHLEFHTCHWTATGPSFFSLHKMYEDLYSKTSIEYDDLAEKAEAMADDNPTWGEARIADELLLKLGLSVSPRTVGKYLRDRPTGRTRTLRPRPSRDPAPGTRPETRQVFRG